MVKLESLAKVIETDILVLGGGPSGLWAAKKAKEFADRVVIVDKGPRDWGGLASGAHGGFVAVLPEENMYDFLDDIVYFFDGLCDQKLIEKILEQSIHRLEDYMRLGVEFFTKPDGKLWGLLQYGLEHVALYNAKPFPHGGKIMMRALVNEVERLGVQRLGRVQVTDLLKSNGVVTGAIGFNTLNGEFYVFKANAVVVAAGQCSLKPSFYHNTATGDGIAMSLRAGAEGTNLEFSWPMIAPKMFAWEGLSNLMPVGAKFINAQGESFIEKYSPFGANTEIGFMALAMVYEAKAGRGPIYLDCTPIKPEDRALTIPTHGWMKTGYEKLKKIGVDLLEQKVEWVPFFESLKGALNADVEGRTNVHGLFACGRARAFDTATYLCGSSLAMTAVTGHITGEVASKYAGENKPLPVDEYEVKALKTNLFAPLGKAGIPPKEVLREIQETVFPVEVYHLKSESSLKKALARIEYIRDELLPKMGAKDTHYLMKSIEVRSIALLTELFLRASLMRTESRSGHLREDYPNRNDKNWLGWIVINRKGEDTNLRFEPLPLGKYKIKPTRFYSDNFNFPK